MSAEDIVGHGGSRASMLEPGSMTDHGTLIICLDFELYWGVRDKKSIEQYRANLLGVREAVPRMLDLFFRYGIHATWATVGFLFFEGKQELLDSLPVEKPTYQDESLSPYPLLNGIGENEHADPYHFAPSLISRIHATPGQEIGTHTFSHYYCLEPGQTKVQFRADLEAAASVAARRGIELRSIVFPRNQVNPEYLPICSELGLRAYRGTERASFHQAGNGASASNPLKRAQRLLDAYLPLGSNTSYSVPDHDHGFPLNLPSSRFLRPYSQTLRSLDSLRRRRITYDLLHAAKQCLTYHLWWHPHNFGVQTGENLAFLESIFREFDQLRAQHGMESSTMFEAAEKAAGT
jgi:peptidoglycan/xylan/chitin deacetylase (PgdA/CDA1 family)